MLVYFSLKLPFIVAQIIPVCILMSVLIVFSLMARNNEILALKSSGIRIYYLFKPVFIIGCVSGILLFFLSDVIVPVTMDKSNRIWLKDVKKKSTVITKENDVWIKGNRRITHLNHVDPKSEIIYGITHYSFDEGFRLVRRLDAEKGVFQQGRWELSGVMEQNLDKEKDSYSISFHADKTEALDLSPEDLKQVVKNSEEMTFRELFLYIKKVEAEGYDATIYRVDLYAKTAFPFICLIMSMVGTGLAARGTVKEGMPVVISYGIGTAFVYWIFYSFCLSLGYGEMLPPGIAAWIANLAFFCFGVLTLVNAE